MKSLLIDLLRSIGLGVVFGSIMAVVSSGFVLGVLYFTGLRGRMDFMQSEIYGISLNPIVILWLLLAASLVVMTRRLANIDAWQTPADSIYAAHLPDSRLDHKKGFASTLAAFISASGGASVGQYGPLVHFGGVMGSLFRRVLPVGDARRLAAADDIGLPRHQQDSEEGGGGEGEGRQVVRWQAWRLEYLWWQRAGGGSRLCGVVWRWRRRA